MFDKIEFRNGVLFIDDKPIDTLEKLLVFYYITFGKKYTDQLLVETYHMYKADPESAARAEEELRNVNIRIK